MSSMGSILNVARLAINAHQTAIQVASHNIANAETPGYSRQRAVLVENTPERTPIGLLGTGVLTQRIDQMRDSRLDASFRRESSQSAGFGLRSDLLGQLEGVFNEPSEGAFASTLDAFWNAWSDLANTPGNDNARDVLKQRGSQVAMALNAQATRLGELTADTGLRLDRSVAQFNGYAQQVAALNGQIVAAEAGAGTAGDLRDARNIALDAMARLAPVQVIERGDGSIQVTLDNQSVVDGSSAKALRYGGNPPGVQLTFAGSAERLNAGGGELGAMLQVLNEDIPQARARLDDLAAGIVSAVNTVHRTGWSPGTEPAGDPPVPPPGWAGSNVDFFDPAGVSASTISLSAAVQADRGAIAASGVYGGAGDNAVARQLSQLRDTAVSIGTPPASLTLGTHYRDTVTGIAIKASSVSDSAAVYDTIAAQAEVRRQSVSGVSTDEELIDLMRHQQAYVAATRLVTAVDEMTQALLNMI
jgi:flagellar hook-associated protein 1 FlgK